MTIMAGRFEKGPRRLCACLVVLALVPVLTACDKQKPASAPLQSVKVVTVQREDHEAKVTVTGTIKARVESNLSFRLTGPIIAEKADVGDHVVKDQVLALIDPKQLQADVDAASAAVAAAEARLQQVNAAFDRQKALLAQGFTTRSSYDQALQDVEVAKGTLDSDKAQLSSAKDSLAQTVLRAPSDGVITARTMDTGAVAQAAQTVFVFAEEGPRDAVANVQEQVVDMTDPGAPIGVALLTDPGVRAEGEIRETAPTVDAATGTVRVKVGLKQTPPQMLLGASVGLTFRSAAHKRVILPWTALASNAGKPAVFVVDPASHAVAYRDVVIESYEQSKIVIKQGLNPGERVVTAGGQMLRPGQIVEIDGEGRS
ncbi:efflux RND transporter periplasmic adaptor subunit [Allorhizobium sp. BGMRC 0089]|uniref:efflux RND transporter periplasmic adaptor subunit n=1 Tax=Allorhizobium sonneratiae TaxID=2934936 RepID=UPI00203412FA|nr:efflux RND transporter periplasmic adaptor subunit [Allorhizobium sonneratiae]MCM2292464.1 efflux RND transporter periplasmic adaptor subunit [Allorhizobium sonneratiae]